MGGACLDHLPTAATSDIGSEWLTLLQEGKALLRGHGLELWLHLRLWWAVQLGEFVAKGGADELWPLLASR